MNLEDRDFGGFLVSKNVLAGVPIRYSFREESSIPKCNGWTLYSARDDDDYISDPENFAVINATTMQAIAPVMLALYFAPYGTDLFWRYEKGVLVGFYDLKQDRETTIAEILQTK